MNDTQDIASVLPTYTVFKAGSLRDRLVSQARFKMYEVMRSMVPIDEMETILDVGVTTDKACGFSNFFERLTVRPERITAISDQDASWISKEWKGVKFVRGDARRMPFEDDTFDFVFSSAVIEHVGSRACQLAFLKECVRVARKHIFITTPNRWYPLEMHSGLPILHWLPPTLFRRILYAIGFHELAKESNLNLLSSSELRVMCSRLEVKSSEIRFIRFFGLRSNILLHIMKNPTMVCPPPDVLGA